MALRTRQIQAPGTKLDTIPEQKGSALLLILGNERPKRAHNDTGREPTSAKVEAIPSLFKRERVRNLHSLPNDSRLIFEDAPL